MAYSDTYWFGRNCFRYNYETGQLECLKRGVKVKTVNGTYVPVVYDSVTMSISLKPSLWEKCPGYWTELFNSLLERERQDENGHL